MQISAIKPQANNNSRVNVFIDGKYHFSLDILQVTELGLKVGQKVEPDKLVELEQASDFGKLYARTLDYCLRRPRSIKEVRDYLYKKTLTTKYKSKTSGEIKQRAGVSTDTTEKVLQRLQAKGYLDDAQFTRWWVDNRQLTKGISKRKLKAELLSKGVDLEIIESQLDQSERNEQDELLKIIAKKQSRYTDRQKLIAYLARQGFSYDDIRQALGS